MYAFLWTRNRPRFFFSDKMCSFCMMVFRKMMCICPQKKQKLFCVRKTMAWMCWPGRADPQDSLMKGFTLLRKLGISQHEDLATLAALAVKHPRLSTPEHALSAQCLNTLNHAITLGKNYTKSGNPAKIKRWKHRQAIVLAAGGLPAAILAGNEHSPRVSVRAAPRVWAVGQSGERQQRACCDCRQQRWRRTYMYSRSRS